MDGWMDGWMDERNGWIRCRWADKQIHADWRWRDGNDKMHADGWINRFMQIGDGWMGMTKWMQMDG